MNVTSLEFIATMVFALLMGAPVTSHAQVCPSGTWGPSCVPCPGGTVNPCNGHGVCSDGAAGSGLCSCNVGYIGSACQYSDATTCSGHGTVSYQGSCSCIIGFAGTDCNQCAVNYYGPTCTYCTSALNCNSHGFCSTSGNGSCICDLGYGGTNCQPVTGVKDETFSSQPIIGREGVSLALYSVADLRFFVQALAKVELEIFDLDGTRILKKDLGAMIPGEHVYQLSTEDHALITSGFFLYRFNVGKNWGE